jgi:glycosyltransferase involved in cell wall biosynthesis
MASLSIVAQRYPDVKLLMTGKTGSEVIDLASKYQVDDRLILTGFLPYEELPWYLGCADLFVLPFPDTIYNRGRWPNKINDYLSLGRPTVANACGDLTHLFEKHEVGLLAEWDEADFAQKIMMLLENRDLAHRFGEEARRISVHDYCWPVQIERLENFYYHTLAKKSVELN